MKSEPHLNDINPQVQMMELMIRDRRADRRFRILRLVIVVLIPVLVFVSKIDLAGLSIAWPSSTPQLGVIRITGTVGKGNDRADVIVPQLTRAFTDPNVKTIALMIDSGGGSPIDAERINTTIDTLKRAHQKPVIAVINSLGASAAYLIAMHADKVVAGRFSLVGSIGAVIESWNVSGALRRFDVEQHAYSSGPLKSMLNPFIPSTPVADQKAQALVNVLAKEFVDELIQRRGPKLSADVRYDTGEVWNGEAAKRIGLIDSIGTIEDIVTELKVQYPNLRTHDYAIDGPAIRFGLTDAIDGLLSITAGLTVR
ncbi:S49 family peptidase (plasmid) [Burkholderia aenigmatica]|uniref:S49 family peptidase n=1 Tax=Burkholderia aenigmatica TaxID=2015348 RepID=UPI003B438861